MDKIQEHIYIAELLTKYSNQNISEDELLFLRKTLIENPFLKESLRKFQHTRTINDSLTELEQINTDLQWSHFLNKNNYQTKTKTKQTTYIIWLTSVAALLCITLSIFWKKEQPISSTFIVQDTTYGYKNDVTPGVLQATLTLDDGTIIPLGNQSNITNIVENNYSYISNKIIEFKPSLATVETKLFKIKTPRGGTFQAILADGTKIWLNSNSEIEFPNQFNSSVRTVKLLTGEIYFDVAKDKDKPFIVQTQLYNIKVLGTSFNVNSHLPNKVKTLLVEGSVHISTANKSLALSPGESVENDGSELKTQTFDIKEATFWRDGYFYFDGKNIKEIAEDLARWYDIEIVTRATLDNTVFMGSAKRSHSLAKICNMISDMSKYDFEINGKELIIKNKEGGN